MTIGVGTRVGAYEITELVGEGGMGTVYRAHDQRLGRDVAIKVIRASLAADSERVVRFEREARLLASLSHPHIATVHGLEQAGETRLLVLELVPGLTLAERLRDGPLPFREALTFAMQIAAAIEAAHDRGIIHRDLKPANIKITPAGTVKVLDFGLAKALAVDPTAEAIAASPTLTSGGTGEGVILGTAAYMSPEQARGKEVDKRTDVWSFGCVFFDMLTGRTAFAGETLSDTIAAILTRDPDWDLVPREAPASIRRLLRRCLQKDVYRRLRDMGDARLEIEEALGTPHEERTEPIPAPGPAVPVNRMPRRLLASWLAGGLLAGGLLGASGYALLGSDSETPRRPAAQFTIPLAANERLAGLDFPSIAISRDDTHLAYVGTRGGRQQLFVRPLASLDAQPLAGTEGAQSPFFSPDGKWIAFFASGELKKIPTAGGPVRSITRAEIGFGGVWAPDNHIIFAPSNASELMRVAADGGDATAVTTLNTSRGEFSHRWPELLPDGVSLLFTVGTEGSWDDAEIAVQRIGSKDRQTIVHGGTAPRYASSGHVLYTRGGVLHALPFDADAVKPAGEPRSGSEQVLQSIDGAAQMSVSASGSFVFVPGSGADGARTLAWLDREGNPQPLAAPPRAYSSPRLAPDGRTIAVAIGGARNEVWTYDIATTRLTQLTFDGGDSPVWSPSGNRVIFAASRGGPAALFSKAADGTGSEERLTGSQRTQLPHAVTPDGAVLFVESDVSGRDIALATAGAGVRPLLATPANESAPAITADGRWMAFVSDASGRPEVYVAPFSDPSRSVQVSTTGGAEPVWRRDGGELFFRAGGRLLAATLRARSAPAFEPARELLSVPFEKGSASRPAYDVSHDGTRFLIVRAAQVEKPGSELRVYLNWRP